MLFNSLDFYIFLPIVFLLYWCLFKPVKWQNLLVVVVSYIFYGWWDWRFLLLIALTTFCSFASGVMIEMYEGKRNVQKIISASNIILNLSILGVFKYYNFFSENLAIILQHIGLKPDWPTLNVILPVGISFYTFQALSYTIDVYRGKINATKDIIAFFAFISFFPQLVAGPIERATNLLPQFLKSRSFDYTKAVDGMRQMLWGFFKKMVIADNCASFVNEGWREYSNHSGIALICVGILFTFQIYCDFSGYSDIAIGCAKLFGIKLMQNFNLPYFSRSIPEFWRRWHISLTTWFRDYIYFPLGGSRCNKWKIIRNVYIVWGISGLWHGANWTFVCWGLFHATLLAIYNIFGINTKYKNVVAYGKWLPNIKELMQMTLTFCLAVIGWIIFRAESLTQAKDFFISIVSNNFGTIDSVQWKSCLASCFILLIIEWLQRTKEHPLQFSNSGIFKYRLIRWFIYIGIVILIDQYAGVDQTFIYFQF